MLIPTQLINAIRDGKCLPIIGAGFSLNADLPSGKSMPNWAKLVEALNKSLKLDTRDPLQIPQKFKEKFGRITLLEELRQILHAEEAKPGHVHRHLVKLSYFDTICTTNFDMLLEEACRQEGKKQHTIVLNEDVALHGKSRDLKIVKMHGDFNHLDRIVITKEDYENYQIDKNSIAKYISSLLMSMTPLYLGFSLQDPNFKKIRQIAAEVMGDSVRKGFILLFDPDAGIVKKYEEMNLIVVPLNTNGKQKAECLLEFLKEIHEPLSITETTELEVSANKTVLFYGQTLEIRTRTKGAIKEPITIRIYTNKGVILEDTLNDAVRLDEELLSKKFVLKGEKWEIEKDYTIVAEYKGNKTSDSFYLDGPVNIVAQTDSSVYVYGSDIIFTAIVPQAYIDSFINYKILHEGNVIHEGKIKVDSEETGIFQQLIAVEGTEWRTRGEEYEIIAEYDGKRSVVTICTSNFGAGVELDQKVYTWTDKVFITVVAPDYNFDSTAIDSIMVTVKTKNHQLPSYVLKETGPNTGIFTGEVILTGNPKIKGKKGVDGLGMNPTGKKGGRGPTDGFLPCEDKDGLTVSFEYNEDETVVGSALIRWNIGEIQFLEANYSAPCQGVIRVIDPDMNLNPEKIDSFKINVWSDSDAVGTQLTVYETNESTGIFEGIILFTKTEKSSANMLRVADGDTVTAEYSDRTLPSPYTIKDELEISATTTIGALSPPLERVSVRNLMIVDENDNLLDEIKKGQLVRIKVSLKNNRALEQPFAYLVQITDEEETALPIMGSSGKLKPKESVDIFQHWKPTIAGRYNLQIFVWKSVDQPDALSPPLSTTITVK